MNDEGYEAGRKAFVEGRGFLDNPWLQDGDEAHEIKGRRFVDGMVDALIEARK